MGLFAWGESECPDIWCYLQCIWILPEFQETQREVSIDLKHKVGNLDLKKPHISLVKCSFPASSTSKEINLEKLCLSVNEAVPTEKDNLDNHLDL